jgi:hypothetical protein
VYPTEPSVDGVGDAPLSWTRDGVSELCLAVAFCPLVEWLTLLRWTVGFDELWASLGSSSPSSPSGMASRRSGPPSSSYSSDEEPGLSRLADCAVLEEPLLAVFDVDVSG